VELKPGMLIANRYWILSHLGSGGMAEVYHAQDKNLLRDTAVKLLHTDLSRNPQFLERFQQEARAAANLSHPNLVTVFDFGTDGEAAFLVMEYIEGQDLKGYIRQHAPLPIPEAVRLMQQICSGAGYAHRAGLVHCDLKPQNILLTMDGRAKIADFGIARTLADINPEEQSDIVWGSPQYLAWICTSPSPLLHRAPRTLPFPAPSNRLFSRSWQKNPPHVTALPTSSGESWRYSKAGNL